MAENLTSLSLFPCKSVSPEAPDLLLRMGEHDFGYIDFMGHIDRKVQFVISHPKYEPGYPWEYDLALLRFEEPVKFAENLIPICLPYDNEDLAGQTGWITGWGQLYEKGKEFICISTKTINYSPNWKRTQFTDFQLIFFCLIFMKIRHKRCASMDGTQLI